MIIALIQLALLVLMWALPEQVLKYDTRQFRKRMGRFFAKGGDRERKFESIPEPKFFWLRWSSVLFIFAFLFLNSWAFAAGDRSSSTMLMLFASLVFIGAIFIGAQRYWPNYLGAMALEERAAVVHRMAPGWIKTAEPEQLRSFFKVLAHYREPYMRHLLLDLSLSCRTQEQAVAVAEVMAGVLQRSSVDEAEEHKVMSLLYHLPDDPTVIAPRLPRFQESWKDEFCRHHYWHWLFQELEQGPGPLLLALSDYPDVPARAQVFLHDQVRGIPFFPNAYCVRHFRWAEATSDTKFVICPECQSSEHLVYPVERVIGRIGKVREVKLVDRQLILPVWNAKTQTALWAEMDELQVESIEQLDWALASVLNHLRQLPQERYPKLKLAPGLALDPNTLRMLADIPWEQSMRLSPDQTSPRDQDSPRDQTATNG